MIDTTVTRRTFLGFLGGVLVSTAVPDLFLSPETQSDAGSGIRYLYDLSFLAADAGRWKLKRSSGSVLISLLLGEHAKFRWVAAPGHEIVMPPSEPFVVLEGPGTCQDWDALWSDAKGRHHTKFRNGIGITIDVEQRLGARARRRFNRL